jgi:hypothetical protein
MIVIFGTYHWAPKLVSFRQDWCTVCDGERLVVGRRTIDFGHIFWIPLLPFGRWTRWRCGTCGEDPARSAETRRPLRIIAWMLIVFFLVGTVLSFGDFEIHGNGAWFAWALGVLGIAYMTWWAFKPFDRGTYKEKRARVAAFSGSVCPLCEGTMTASIEDSRCSRCDAVHRPVPRTDEAIGPAA